MAFVPRLLHSSCLVHQQGSDSAPEELQRYYTEAAPFAKKGGKTNHNRFMSVVSKGDEEAPWFAYRAFGFCLTCSELDLFTGTRLEKLEFDRAASHEKGTKTTTAAKVTAAERALARSSENQLAVAALAFSDEALEVRHRVLVRVSFRASLEWMNRQISGAFMEAMCAIVSVTTTSMDLAWVGVAQPASPKAAR